MSNLGNLNDIDNLLHQIVARDVAAGVEMARSLGFDVPKRFDVGFQITDRERLKTEQRLRIRIRLNDVVGFSVLLWPYTNGLTPMPKVKQLVDEAIPRLRGDALTMIDRWMSKHPEAVKSMSDEKLRQALDRINSAAENDQLSDAWTKDCIERAKSLHYELKR